MGIADICERLKDITNSDLVDNGEGCPPGSNKVKEISEKGSGENNPNQ